jgi:hypothetical protein
VRETFAKRFQPETRFHIVVTPTGKSPAPASAPSPEEEK